MKRIGLIALIVMYSVMAMAQSTFDLSILESAGKEMKTLKCAFTKKEYVAAANKTTNNAGTLYFVSPRKMKMAFKDAESNDLIINDNIFYMRQGKRAMKVNTDESYQMRLLANTLLYCMSAQISTLASDKGLQGKSQPYINRKEDVKNYIVELVVKNPQFKYSKISLKYSKETKALVYMRMEEVGGNYQEYFLSDEVLNEEIDNAVFNIPVPQKNASANKSR